MSGILERPIHETPIAILDFETTGLNPGQDRVVEASVIRCEPGKQPRLALDTLVNPQRPMAATEIHGITDADVANAPVFADIRGEVVASLSGCALASYNVSIRSRPMQRLVLSAELSNQKDTGGALVRDSWSGSLRADWRLFRLQVAALADYALEKQGDVEQNGFNFNLILRREF